MFLLLLMVKNYLFILVQSKEISIIEMGMVMALLNGQLAFFVSYQ